LSEGLDDMKHQSNCFRTINGKQYRNQCDVMDEPDFALVEKAKQLKIRHRVIKHPDGYGQLFVHPDDERLLYDA
jgi:hypothetical protein